MREIGRERAHQQLIMFTLSIQNLIQTKIEGNLIKLNFCLLDFFLKYMYIKF